MYAKKSFALFSNANFYFCDSIIVLSIISYPFYVLYWIGEVKMYIEYVSSLFYNKWHKGIYAVKGGCPNHYYYRGKSVTEKAKVKRYKAVRGNRSPLQRDIFFHILWRYFFSRGTSNLNNLSVIS